jgi:hypothetical protein
MMKTWAKTWKAWMIEMTSTKNIVGESSGRVIFQKRCGPLAPSTLAAS